MRNRLEPDSTETKDQSSVLVEKHPWHENHWSGSLQKELPRERRGEGCVWAVWKLQNRRNLFCFLYLSLSLFSS